MNIGIQLLTIFEHEWKQNREKVKSLIKIKLGLCDTKLYARKCTLKEISSKVAKNFYDKNHMMNGVYGKYNFGLFYDDELVSAISFSNARMKKNYIEIIRFSSKLNTIVVGGFQKLLSNFNIDKPIISYCDLRFGIGDVYLNSGFKFIKQTNPNYWYFNKYTESIESRVKYQKHKLKKQLKNFNPELTEKENMEANNFLILYDCGNYIFIKNQNNNNYKY